MPFRLPSSAALPGALLLLLAAFPPTVSAQRLVETHGNDSSLGGIEQRRQLGEPVARSLRFHLRVTTDVTGRVTRVDFPVGIDGRMATSIVLQLTGRRHNIPRNVTRVINVEYYSKGGFRID